MYCSRFAATKKAAEKIAAKMRDVGGVDVTIKGQRGSWRVRGKVEVARFAKFCADEARHEQSLSK
jgi:menaquinone-dependent protoporphyrinogen IX oxidase